MSDQEELQRAIYEINMIERQMKEIEGQLQNIQALRGENEATRKALAELPKDETFFGLGSGTMIRAKISSTDKAMVDIGAGAIAEKPIPEIVAILEERDTQLQALFARLENDFNNAGKALDSVSQRAGEIQAKLRG
ncbi:MAG: prefoldin subunit alpha [Candidatus Micrarchaeota archaeon]